AALYQRHQIIEGLRRLTVDAQDAIAGLNPGGFGGAALRNGADHGRDGLLAYDGEEERERDDGQHVIGGRTGEDEGGALPKRLVMERHRALRGAHVTLAPVRL